MCNQCLSPLKLWVQILLCGFFRFSPPIKLTRKECILLHNTFPSAKVFSLYIFTLLMFRRPNKTRINKNKTIHFYRHTYFRLSNVDLWFVWFVITCGRFQIWNTCIVPCIYWLIAFLNKLVIFFLKQSLLSRVKHINYTV